MRYHGRLQKFRCHTEQCKILLDSLSVGGTLVTQQPARPKLTWASAVGTEIKSDLILCTELFNETYL